MIFVAFYCADFVNVPPVLLLHQLYRDAKLLPVTVANEDPYKSQSLNAIVLVVTGIISFCAPRDIMKEV